MSNKKYAFPIPGSSYATGTKTQAYHDAQFGMTLRDYFAGQAIVGIIDNFYTDGLSNYTFTIPIDFVASKAYEIADAMIKEREK